MADPIGDAFVRVVPDFTGFRAELQAGVNQAVRQVQAQIRTTVAGPAGAASAAATVQTAVAVDTAAAAAAQATLATAFEGTAVAEAQVTAESVALLRAQAAVDAANLRLTQSTARVNTLLAAETVDSNAVSVALARQAAATSSLAAANARVGLLQGAGAAGLSSTATAAAKAEEGILGAANSSNALRGSLIGLSRITPVAVFGLGAYGTAAIAAGLAVRSVISSTADFEHQLNILAVTTEATPAQLKEIHDEAKALGADLSLPAVSAGDAAVALTELSKAGLSVQDTLAAGRGVLQLSAAAQIGVAEAAQITATQLNAFGLAGSQATHVADLLAGASISAQGEIADFGVAFQQVAAVANQVDLSIEETTGALTELALAGLKGADGGTSLRTMLLRLAPTTKQAAQFQKALGIEIDKTRSVGEQLPELLDQYRHALQLLTPVQQQQALAQIFGQDAIRAASILIDGGSEALAKNTKAADDNGAAARIAAANAEGLSGAFAGLKSNAETLGITVGELVSGPLTELLTMLADITGAVNTAAEAIIGLGSVHIDVPGIGGFDLSQPLGVFSKFGAAAALTPGSPLGSAAFIGNEVRKRAKDLFGPGIDAYVAELEAAQRKIEEENRLHAQVSAAKQEASIQALFPATGAPDEDIQAAAKAAAAPFVSAEARAARARLEALTREKTKNDKLTAQQRADITAPVNLQIPLLRAQINESLSAELVADRAIQAYFQERLKLADEGTARYAKILGALQNAAAASQAVRDQIAAAAKAKRDANEAIRKQLEKDAEQAKADAEAARVAQFNLQRSQLELQIQIAQTLTPNNLNDDRTAFQREIAFLNNRIKDLRKIKEKTVEQKQEIVDLSAAVVTLKGSILGLKDANESGFSVKDVFDAVISDFTTFAGNIGPAGAVLTPQGERQAFGNQLITGGNEGVAASIAKTALTAQQQRDRTNALLEQLVINTGGNSGRGAGGKPTAKNIDVARGQAIYLMRGG